jgi:hypothetical protein
MTITLTREEAQQVLDAMEAMQTYTRAERKGLRIFDEAIETLRARLAQPEREWQELTDEEIKRYKPVCADLDSFRAGVKAVEAKLKEKNNGR